MTDLATKPPQTSHDTERVASELRVATDGRPFVFDAYRADATPCVSGRKRADKQFEQSIVPILGELHDRMLAAEQHSLLVVLQGLDASGKSGAIKHVARAFNPCRTSVACFKEPDGKEEDEHFLARIRRQLPDPGMVAFFDRSHYEDAIAPRAAGELDDKALTARLKEIQKFESDLVANGTVIVKCLLHISYDEQRERFLRRLQRPDKQWKFTQSDLDTRAEWPVVEAAYCEVVGRTSYEFAPWYVIPADHKWYRNWAIGSLLAEHMLALHDSYPELDGDADAIAAQLEAPY